MPESRKPLSVADQQANFERHRIIAAAGRDGSGKAQSVVMIGTRRGLEWALGRLPL